MFASIEREGGRRVPLHNPPCRSEPGQKGFVCSLKNASGFTGSVFYRMWFYYAGAAMKKDVLREYPLTRGPSMGKGPAKAASSVSSPGNVNL